MINQFSLSIATLNGSGSQSANTILAKCLFRMGLQVGVQNLFPSNIAGLPTWFSIRVHPRGYTSRSLFHDIVVAKNPETIADDVFKVAPGGVFFYASEIKDPPLTKRSDIQTVAIPFRELTETCSDSIKMRKLLSNMVYVGVLAELLRIDNSTLHTAIADQFGDKASVVAANQAAADAGRSFARDSLANFDFKWKVKAHEGANDQNILIDGNTAAALGAVTGGCTFVSWYPITPSTSLAESFERLAHELRPTPNGRKNHAVVQAEDELSAIGMVVGAGWAGARSMTATSGPGLSLMAEIAGLSYFAEIPAVIWDVQRAGPSTGLPTRTMQGDLSFAAHLSHGDTEHIVLLPGSIEECFEFAENALDSAEEFQTLVIVLSDLDMGMNLRISRLLTPRVAPYRRGKVLDAEALNSVTEFARYRDVDGDGVGYRTLPGTMHAHAAYFTRGTGHTDKATYSEDGEIFAENLTRLKRKLQTAAKVLPPPLVTPAPGAGAAPSKAANLGLLLYGSSSIISQEVQETLAHEGLLVDVIRVRALPFHPDLEGILARYPNIAVVEQNRDGQMRGLLLQNYPQFATRLTSVVTFDGLPISAEFIAAEVRKKFSAQNVEAQT
jgi:2-oxoglutarate ferredoxin oxidoreductase subunit alpha